MCCDNDKTLEWSRVEWLACNGEQLDDPSKMIFSALTSNVSGLLFYKYKDGEPFGGVAEDRVPIRTAYPEGKRR